MYDMKRLDQVVVVCFGRYKDSLGPPTPSYGYKKYPIYQHLALNFQTSSKDCDNPTVKSLDEKYVQSHLFQRSFEKNKKKDLFYFPQKTFPVKVVGISKIYTVKLFAEEF